MLPISHQGPKASARRSWHTRLEITPAVAELYSGMRGGEQEALERFLSAFNVVDIDQTLAEDAGLCRRDCRPAYGTGLADAIVAMSAKAKGATLVTSNRRHYPMVTDLLVP